MRKYFELIVSFTTTNENRKFLLLKTTEISLVIKIYEKMQTLPMIDLMYNTLTTVVPSPLLVPSPTSSNNISTSLSNQTSSSSSSWFNQLTSSDNNNLYNLEKHHVLLGSGSSNFTNNINNYNITGGGGADNEGNYLNGTYLYDDNGSDSDVHKEFIFDRTDVRVIFITLYSLVFCCCFFGK